MHARAVTEASAATDVNLARGGDREAFARLVRHYQNAVSAVALAMTKSVAVSQDVSQAAFIEAWRSLPALRSPDSFGPWLLQLTRRQALQHARGSKRSVARDTAFYREQAGVATSAEELLQAKEQEQLLLQALEEVPSDSRELLLLYYREGRATDQVAALLGLSPAAVRKRLERSREILRDKFEAIESAAKRSAPGVAFVALVMSGLGATTATAATAASAIAIGKWMVLAAMVAASALWLTSDQQDAAPGTAKQAPVSAIARLRAIARGHDVATAPPTDAWSASDDETLDPVLAARAQVHVSGTVSLPDGGPASGALVLWSTQRATLRATVDASGHYALRVPEESYRVAAHLDDLAGGLEQPVHAKADGDWSHVDLTLAKGARIDGVVRFADGQPATQANVRLSAHGKHGDWIAQPTDDSGTFSFTGLPPGAFDVEATHPTRAQHLHVEGASVLQGGSFFAELQFKAATPTRGVLHDDVGAPLAGWRVRLDDPTHADLATTANDGTFSADEQWAMGKHRIFLFAANSVAPAHRPSWPSGDLAAIQEVTVTDDQPLELQVRRTGTVALHARGNTLDGRPYATVNFHIVLPVGGWVQTWSITKKLDEHAQLSTPLPAGEYFVSVSAGIDDGSESAGFPLKLATGELTQRELSTKNGDPVKLTVREANGLIVQEARLAQPMMHAPHAPDGAMLLEFADACPCQVAVAVGERIGTTTVQPGQTEAEIVMPAAGRIHGRVIGASGSFAVQVATTGTSCWFCGPDEQRFAGTEFSLNEVATGPARITVSADGRSAAKDIIINETDTTEVELTLGPTASFHGRIEVKDGALPRPTPLVLLDRTTPQQSGSDGSFAFKDVATGPHSIVVQMFNRDVATVELNLTANTDVALDTIVLDPTTLPTQPTLRDRTKE